MTSLAPILQAFLTDHLMTQRRVSPHTVAAYRDTFKLLLHFAHARSGKQPARLDLVDLDAPLIAAFLHHLETDRGNSVSTTRGSRQFIRCFATRRCASRSTQRSSNGSCPYPQSAATAASSASSPRRKSMPSSKPRTDPPGPVAAIMHCCCSR